MAGASDKARFYLEQYVPELQEFERKGIFTSDEITAIASKRSDFEHILNARGSRPTDYARYVTYEMNLDRLRKKRSKRLGIKATAFSGQRTIFFILDRATKKFPGDMGLWMQYVHFCQKEKANKKLAKLFTTLLRLKPREWGLWVLAAKHYAEDQGDMSTARSYMQRGLRFCKDEDKLWLEYLRLEMGYLAKLAARRKILGIEEEPREAAREQAEDGEDFLTLPSITAADLESDKAETGDATPVVALQKLDSTPAFSGGIPIAIFDAAMKQFEHRPDVAEKFFEMVATVDRTAASERILNHMLEHMQQHQPHSPSTVICEARLSLHGIDANGAQFPVALGRALASLKQGQVGEDNRSRLALAEKVVLLLIPYLRSTEGLDADVEKVLESTLRRQLRMLHSESAGRGKGTAAEQLLENLRKEGRDADVEVVQQRSGFLQR